MKLLLKLCLKNNDYNEIMSQNKNFSEFEIINNTTFSCGEHTLIKRYKKR